MFSLYQVGGIEHGEGTISPLISSYNSRLFLLFFLGCALFLLLYYKFMDFIYAKMILSSSNNMSYFLKIQLQFVSVSA